MAAACGHMHTAAVGEDGTLYAWGSQNNGRLGNGQTRKQSLRPMPIAGLPAVAQVAVGLNHTAIVTDAGDLLLCGQGAFGQLGLDDNFPLPLSGRLGGRRGLSHGKLSVDFRGRGSPKSASSCAAGSKYEVSAGH